jgi:vacuolar protein sorting-associated protein 45
VDAELRSPRFKRYDICFSGVVDPSDVERLAAADVGKRVSEVFEYYLDYLVIDRTLFSLNMVGCAARGGRQFASGRLGETALSVVSATLALAMRPVVRCRGSSDMCRALAERVSEQLGQPDGNGLLLVLDRRDDPITPLLNQWTYQAMLHELLGIRNGTVAASVSGQSCRRRFLFLLIVCACFAPVQ